MIYEALIVPRERAPTLRDIKRALLTYDKVVLVDPSDRELLPRDAFPFVVTDFAFFGPDLDPIRPLGKTLTYDEQFEQMLDAVAPAIVDGLIEVRSTSPTQPRRVSKFGGANASLRLYRHLASRPEYLRAAIESDWRSLAPDLKRSPGLVVEGRADWVLGDSPALPELQSPDIPAELHGAITCLARGRLGAIVKYSGYCEQKNLVPVFSACEYGRAMQLLLNNATNAAGTDDETRAWAGQQRTLDLCHEEFLVDRLLDDLSIHDVLRLRTVAWGRQARAREALFEAIRGLAADGYDHGADARTLIDRYRKDSEELVRERENLHFEINCDLGQDELLSGAGLVGLQFHLESPDASPVRTARSPFQIAQP